MSESNRPMNDMDPEPDDSIDADDEPNEGTDVDGDLNENAELRARVETLEAENERLRALTSAMYRRRYRHTSIGLAVIGTVALLGAAVVPSIRSVLVALGATGFFAALFTYYITPEQFVTASVGERIYRTLADNEASLVDDLQLQGTPRVVPATGSAAPARLFVPIDDETRTPSDDLLEPFRVNSEPGLILQPTGASLYEILDASIETDGADPVLITNTVGEALTAQFELIESFESDIEPERATLAVEESVYGPVDRFDHPVSSLLATTLAVELSTPVTVTVEESDDRGEWFITCRWDADRDTEPSA